MWMMFGVAGVIGAMAYVTYALALLAWDELGGHNANQRAIEVEREQRREQHRKEQRESSAAAAKFSADWHRRNQQSLAALRVRQEKAQEARINELSERYKQ